MKMFLEYHLLRNVIEELIDLKRWSQNKWTPLFCFVLVIIYLGYCDFNVIGEDSGYSRKEATGQTWTRVTQARANFMNRNLKH